MMADEGELENETIVLTRSISAFAAGAAEELADGQAELPPNVLDIFDNFVNYPLHMHFEIPLERRPTTMNELISGCYCMVYDPNWIESFPVDELLKSWLLAQPGTS